MGSRSQETCKRVLLLVLLSFAASAICLGAEAEDTGDAFDRWLERKVPPTVKGCDVWFLEAPRDCAVGAAEGCVGYLAECLRKAMIHTVDQRLLPLKKRDAAKFKREMQLQAHFARGLPEFCEKSKFNAGGIHADMENQNCLVAMYLWREASVQTLLAGGSLEPGQDVHLGPWVLGDEMRRFAEQFCDLYWQASWGKKTACLPRELAELDAAYVVEGGNDYEVNSWNTAIHEATAKAVEAGKLDLQKLPAEVRRDLKLNPGYEAEADFGTKELYRGKRFGQTVAVVELGRDKGYCGAVCPVVALWVHVADWTVVGEWYAAKVEILNDKTTPFPVLAATLGDMPGSREEWRFDDKALAYKKAR